MTLLTEAAADGRLTPTEHADRSERALAARTLRELMQVTADLAVPSGQPIKLYPRRVITALFARERRDGRWVVPETFLINAFFSDVFVDLRDAIWQSRRTVVYATAVAGRVRLVLPPEIAVQMISRTSLGIRRVRGVVPDGRVRSRASGVLEIRTLMVAGAVTAITPQPPRRRGRGAAR